MYPATTVKNKRRYTSAILTKPHGRLPYSNAAPIKVVTFQEQLLQVTTGNTHGDLINQTSEKIGTDKVI
jgi:hypothetical protein